MYQLCIRKSHLFNRLLVCQIACVHSRRTYRLLRRCHVSRIAYDHSRRIVWANPFAARRRPASNLVRPEVSRIAPITVPHLMPCACFQPTYPRGNSVSTVLPVGGATSFGGYFVYCAPDPADGERILRNERSSDSKRGTQELKQSL